MKFIISLLMFLMLVQGPGKAPSQAPRDREMEKESTQSLEVAKYYFYKRKPWKNDKDGWDRINKSIEGRLQEILDTNPSFGQTSDVYFMLGELYNRMGDKGKAIKNWELSLKDAGNDKLKLSAQKRLDENKIEQQKIQNAPQQKIQKKGR